MYRFRCLVLFLSAALLVSCLPASVKQTYNRGGRSEVRIYLQPIPPEAARISWTVDEMAIVRSDGIRFPMTLHTQSLQGSRLQEKQINLASGFVSPGDYVGISLSISEASLTRENGDAELVVPEGPFLISGSFQLASSEVLPLFVDLHAEGLLEGGFAFTPDFSLAFPARELDSLTGYLTIPEGDQIVVFNRKTLRVTGAVATGRDPGAMTIDPVRSRAYVVARGDNAVDVVDIIGGGVRERIVLRSDDEPVDLALSDDGLMLLTANYGSDTVSIIDPVQGVETERLDVSRGPTSVTVNGNGTRAYVTCFLSGSLSIIDLSTGTLSATLPIEGMAPHTAALGGEEDYLFVVGENSPELAVVDTAALTTIDRIYVGTEPVSVAVDERSGLVFVGRKFSSEIGIVDPSSHLPIDHIGLSGFPGHMTVDLQEKALFVVLPVERTLQKVDLVNRRVLAEIKLDSPPQEVAVIE